MQNAFAHAFEIAVGPAEMRQLAGDRVLCIHVFAPATLENQLDLDFVLFPLIEMDDGGAWPEIVAGVLTRDRINRVRSQLSSTSRFPNRLANLLTHPDLIHTDGYLHLEGGHSSVLRSEEHTSELQSLR